MQNASTYVDVKIRPDWRQLLIDELVSILAAIALIVVGGLDGVPYHSVFFCLGLALVFKAYYRFVYLRCMHYTITGEQLVSLPKDQADGFFTAMEGEIGKICSSPAQIAGVANCTTQTIQQGLRLFHVIPNMTGGTLEHTALDHHISKLDNGNVLVKVTEKPGSLFSFDMEFEVAPDGLATQRYCKITVPSMDKIRAYNQFHLKKI